MADDDITLDGKPLQSLRVADLKAALEQRNLPKTGQKNALMKRLKGALMLENLQKSSSHGGIQPNSQIGEEMSQNSFIKQYLAKQQELLRQKQKREAQLDEEDEEEGDECHTGEDKENPAYDSKISTEDDQVGESFGQGLIAFGSALGSEEGIHGMDPPRPLFQHFYQGQKEPPAAPSPPRAVASLSVRVLGEPGFQGVPPAVPQIQEKANTAPSESTPPVLRPSRSIEMAPAACEDSEEGDGSDDNSDDDDWGPAASRRSSRVEPQPQPPSVAAASVRSKRKLQPPQYIPPPQIQSPLQLRHPTPPPSPPPNLFPLPDTPKQSPPDADQLPGERPKVGAPHSATMQRQDSDTSSRSSSPEPPAKRRPGPLSLLVHKMESEQARDEAQSTSTANMSESQTPARSDSAEAPDTSSAKVIAESHDSDSSSESDSSSPSSSENMNKPRDLKEAHQRQREYAIVGGHHQKSEVSEPSAAAITEEEPDSESSMALPEASGAEPENSEGHVEEGVCCSVAGKLAAITCKHGIMAEGPAGNAGINTVDK
uniref:SAP domain-containing protein n=1 Tax=Knipowitschia caucasica TaxID=637954 RepID=A0AAV2KQD7_KNICA